MWKWNSNSAHYTAAGHLIHCTLQCTHYTSQDEDYLSKLSKLKD